MKPQLCRLCNHEHGLSEPHVFMAPSSNGDGVERTIREKRSARPHVEFVSPEIDTNNLVAALEYNQSKSGGALARRAKASCPVPVPLEKTADEVVPPTQSQAEPSHPKRRDSIAALRNLLTKGLSKSEARELNDLISRLDVRRTAKAKSMQRYRAGVKKRKAK